MCYVLSFWFVCLFPSSPLPSNYISAWQSVKMYRSLFLWGFIAEDSHSTQNWHWINLWCSFLLNLSSLHCLSHEFWNYENKTFLSLAQKTYWYSVYWFLINFFIFMCMQACVDSRVPCTCRNPRTPEEVIRFPGNGVVSHVGAENQTWSRAGTESTANHQINSLLNILIYGCFSKKMSGVFLSHDTILAALTAEMYDFLFRCSSLTFSITSSESIGTLGEGWWGVRRQGGSRAQ